MNVLLPKELTTPRMRASGVAAFALPSSRHSPQHPLIAQPREIPAMPHTVLVTGATGFVGSHVAEALVASRRHRPRSRAHRGGYRVPRTLGVTIVRGDLTDPASLQARGGRRGCGRALRREGRRLGTGRRVPQGECRGASRPLRRRPRQAAAPVRPRQHARRLRGAAPLRHRRDRTAAGQAHRRLHAIEGRGGAARAAISPQAAACR